ncbi:centriolar coiled-coil protein of 110 kDa isoform X2 [Hoplias malabaricus]|uniref:centriolar coiled-coil protein of 110 kDa isoform X2 n=1 Tax=Hoplias malabaricus TaxID=27720 RepID=UPI003462F8B4
MENYEEFIRRKVSQIKSNDKEESEAGSSHWSSDIRFYSFPILPPLLNNDQKEEMQRLREVAIRVMNKKKSSLHRETCIQTILDSVQLRQAPTFDEFKKETGTVTPSKTNSNTHNLQSKNKSDEPIESHYTPSSSIFLPLTQQMPGHITFSHPLTSTACDGQTALNHRPLEAENSLVNTHATVLLEGIPFVGPNPKPAVELNTDYGFDTHSESHKDPQIDVSHQGLSSGYVTIETTDVSSSWIEGIRTDTEHRHSDAHDFYLNFSNLANKANDIISHTPVDGDSLEEDYSVPALSYQAQTHDILEPVHPLVEPDPGDGPYTLSLQNLLKKSQEHRRRQRLLRNQAKAMKANETDQHSLSDKENEECSPADTRKIDLKKIREKNRDQRKDVLHLLKIPSLETQTQSQMTDDEIIRPCVLTSCAKDTDVNVQSEVSLTCLSISSSLNNASSITEKSSSIHPDKTASASLSTSAAASPTAKSLYHSKGIKTGSTLLRPHHAAGKKFKNVPAPKFCLSPVRSKKGSGVSYSLRKPAVRTPVCVEDEGGSNTCDEGKRTVSLSARTKADVPLCRSTDQAEQIAQLELNLSSLKVLISDIESTLSTSQPDLDPPEAATIFNISEQTLLEGVSLPASDAKTQCVVTFSEATQHETTVKDYGTRPGSKQPEPAHCVTSLAQKKRVPEAFRTISDSKQLSQRTTVLADASNQPEEKNNASGEKKKGFENIEDSLNGSSLNRSYDVDNPSKLWAHTGPKGIQLTPELGGQDGVIRAKRRLLMNTAEIMSGRQGDEGRPQSSTPKTSQWPGLQPRQDHEAQVKALMEEQHRQEQELLQSLATRYQFLRSVSFPCPRVGSRLEDVATSTPPSSVSMGSSSQPSALTVAELSILSDSLHTSQSRTCLPVCHRPLVAAAVKGFLTRRLLRTERAAQLIRTIKDTQLFLKDFRSQTPGREYSSRQDQILQERVTLQLRAARYELHDLFFSLSPVDRMQVISWDRELAKERELKRKENKDPQAGGKSALSAATRKALERKRTVMLQKKAGERTKHVLRTENGWSFTPNPRRVPKKTTPLRRPR